MALLGTLASPLVEGLCLDKSSCLSSWCRFLRVRLMLMLNKFMTDKNLMRPESSMVRERGRSKPRSWPSNKPRSWPSSKPKRRRKIREKWRSRREGRGRRKRRKRSAFWCILSCKAAQITKFFNLTQSTLYSHRLFHLQRAAHVANLIATKTVDIQVC